MQPIAAGSLFQYRSCPRARMAGGGLGAGILDPDVGLDAPSSGLSGLFNRRGSSGDAEDGPGLGAVTPRSG